jgi:hypothetical protein
MPKSWAITFMINDEDAPTGCADAKRLTEIGRIRGRESTFRAE